MRNRTLMTIVVLISSIVNGWLSAYGQEATVKTQEVQLSAELMDLLRAEMREIAGGIQTVAMALTTADWETVVRTSETIRASDILEKKLSASQRQELELVLPEEFKKLDQEFHLRAEKLGAAAATHDPEIIAFQFYRLVESCAACHSAYATSRFPGFSSETADIHRH